MDKNEKANIFLPLDKSTKSPDSNLFGGKTLTSSNSSGSLPIFGASSTLSSFSGTFDPSVNQKSTAVSTEELKKQEAPDSKNIFGSVSVVSANESLPFQSSTIFGSSLHSGKISNDPATETDLFKVQASKSSESNSSIFGGEGSKLQTLPASTNITDQSAISTICSPVFPLESRESKDTPDSIFGGASSQVTHASCGFKNFSDKFNFKPGDTFTTNISQLNESNKSSFINLPRSVIPNAENISQNEQNRKNFVFSSKRQENKEFSNQDANVPDNSLACDDIFGVGIGSKTSQTDKPLPVPMKSSTLIAVDIPKQYLEKSVLSNHFSKFGTVKKLLINHKTNQASIYFTNHEDALEAKTKGKLLHPLIPEMKLFFGAQQSPKKITEKKSAVKLIKKSVLEKKSRTVIKKSVEGSAPFLSEKSKIMPFGKADNKNKVPSGNIEIVKGFNDLSKVQAKNNYDRYLILDARDKNMRSKQEKIVDVNKAHYLLAACPDMCPEKERYSRDIQYDISLYEMTNNEIDHKLTVKKFSRSSADKDEPLPHELRPGPVLRMTMDYLICNILDKGDQEFVQVDLWYNFLCNRTRALRNDITQQHLLDMNAVYVLERCIRFHIHCSHDLCEEPADYFDAKINSEHLSKSIQSLKELYHDLAERGYSFSCEPEFRAYEILLNVNDGNVMFKYLQYKKSVRDSKEVQFAIKVYHAINTRNYIKFFKLFNAASYLQACIMHRYFSNVRLNALSVIVKSYSSQALPVHEMMPVLGFSDENKFCQYVKYFGVNVNDSKIIMNKSKFTINPENFPSVLKSAQVTAKKTRSLSETIHNDYIPENPLLHYEPHDSFDSSGLLKEIAYNASDQYITVEKMQLSQCEQKPKTLQDEKHDLMDLQEIESEFEQKLLQMQRVNLLSWGFRLWKKYVHFQKKMKVVDERLIFISVRKFFKIWKDKTKAAAELNSRAQNYFLSKYFNTWRNFIHKEKQQKELLSRCRVINKNMYVRKTLNAWRMLVFKRKIERKANAIRINFLCHKYFNKWRSITKDSEVLRKSEEFHSRKLMKFMFTQWRKWCSAKKNRNKLNVEAFPAIGCLLPLREQNRLLDWGYNRDDKLNISAYQLSQIDDNIYKNSRKHFSLQQLSGIVSWTSLPLVQKFQADVYRNLPDFSGNIQNKCFKVLILMDSDTEPYLVEWVRTKFNILENDDLCKPLECQTRFTTYNSSYSIFIKEKKFDSVCSPHLDGASLVILVSNEDNIDSVENSSQKLKENPYLILCWSTSKEKICKNTWILTKESVDNPLISEKLLNFVLFHWKLRSRHSDLQVNNCFVVLSKYVSDKVLTPVHQIVTQKYFYGKPPPSPYKIVNYYNAAVRHAAVCLEKCKSLVNDSIPTEMYSTSYEEKSKLFNQKDMDVVLAALNDIILPSVTPSFDLSPSSIEETLAEYLKKVIPDSSWGGTLFSEIRNIIKREASNIHYCDNPTLMFYYIPWVEVLSCCISFKLVMLPSVNLPFKLTDLQSFDNDQLWLSEIRLSEVELVSNKKADKLDKTIKRKAGLIIPPVEPKKMKATKSQLIHDIEEEKRKVMEYEEKLKSLLILDDENILLNYGIESKE